MSLIITDKNLGIEVKNAIVKIGYFTVNRTGFFENGQPKFSANLYIEYSNSTEIYFRKCISLDDFGIDSLNFENFYTRMKTLPEFSEAKDNIPVYTEPVKNEVVDVIEKEEQVSAEIIEE